MKLLKKCLMENLLKSFNQVKLMKYKKILITGNFNVIHSGHLKI